MAKNSMRNLNLQIQKAQRTTDRINVRKTMQGTSQTDENQRKKNLENSKRKMAGAHDSKFSVLRLDATKSRRQAKPSLQCWKKTPKLCIW